MKSVVQTSMDEVMIAGENDRLSDGNVDLDDHKDKEGPFECVIPDGPVVKKYPKDLVMESKANSATVRAYEYTGHPTSLTWELQAKICNAAGAHTPGSNDEAHQEKGCSYSRDDNYRVTDMCNWGAQEFRHVSGSLPPGKHAYMCAHLNCDVQVQITCRGYASPRVGITFNFAQGDFVMCSPTGLNWTIATNNSSEIEKFMGPTRPPKRNSNSREIETFTGPTLPPRRKMPPRRKNSMGETVPPLMRKFLNWKKITSTATTVPPRKRKLSKRKKRTSTAMSEQKSQHRTSEGESATKKAVAEVVKKPRKPS